MPSRRMTALFAFIALSFFTNSSAQITVRDDFDREVMLPRAASRIVSLAPSITESICAVGACEQLVGVTDYCDFPESVRSIRHVGGIVNPSIEDIVSLNPDLVVLTPEGNLKESFNHLESIGIRVFVTNPRSIEGIYKSILDIGILTGHGVMAEDVVAAMRAKETAYRSYKGPRPRVLVAVSLQPLIVLGTGTFLAEMVGLAGGSNVVAGTDLTYPALSREEVIASDPEVIVMTGPGADEERLLGLFPEWSGLTAFAHHAVYVLDADLLSRPGPRIMEGVEELRQCFLPDR